MSAHTFVRRAGKGASLPLRAGNYRVHTSRSRWWRIRAADTGVFTSPLVGQDYRMWSLSRARSVVSLSPLAGRGVGGFFDEFDSRRAPLPRPRFASVDLSPQAGRGEEGPQPMSHSSS